MSERSGDWGAGLNPGVGLVLAAGSPAKTMTSLLNIPTVLAKVYLTLKVTSNGSIIDFDLSSILQSIDPDC